MTERACHTVSEALYATAEDRRGPQSYFPRSSILAVFNKDDALRRVYECRCSNCLADAKLDPGPDSRATEFDARELLDKYATVFALLISLDRAGLIRHFQRHKIYLSDSVFLTRANLQFLADHNVGRLESVISKILKDQYSFQIRVVQRARMAYEMDAQEVLPIVLDQTRKGKGSFGEVFGFEFAYPEYRGTGLGHITRFAKKTFVKNSHDKHGLAEWFKSLHANRNEHPHLMPALTAFWQRGIFSIVFEEAELTLAAYLESGGGVFDSPEALWKQVLGLAEGLAVLHGTEGNVVAYHGDLKPANILILHGVMKIADFGLLQIASVADMDGYYSPSPYSSPDLGSDDPKGQRDVWSFGAILCEVATFDLQTKEGLQRFREDRLNDTDPQRHQLKTLSFRIDKALKKSVSEKIDELQSMMADRGQIQQNSNVPAFQQHFFHKKFFDLLREMLWFRPREVPSAEEVATTLKTLHTQAIEAPTRDIWDDVRSGQVRVQNANCQLEVTYARGHCVLLLEDFSRGSRSSVLLGCVLYDPDMNLHVYHEPFMRSSQPCPSFTPIYLRGGRRNTAPQITLEQSDGRRYKFEFNEIKELLILQTAVTQHYPFKFKIFHLKSFKIIPSHFLPFRRSILDMGESTIQLWSQGSLRDDQTLWPYPIHGTPLMHIAIISLQKKALMLIRVTSHPTTSIGDSEAETLVLRNVEYYEIPTGEGIPMKIPEASEGYTELREARLCFSEAQAMQSFYDDLKEFKDVFTTLKKEERERRRG
ncbi:kinase-like domain-containing protein [Aspergillus californicus]